ncbi:hypothetical protein ACFL5O_06800 [Myxococcota bacterium]
MSVRSMIQASIGAFLVAGGTLSAGCGTDSNAAKKPDGSNSSANQTRSGAGVDATGAASDSPQTQIEVTDAGASVMAVKPDAACAAVEEKARFTQVNIVIMVDRSGSMGDPDQGGNRGLRWLPVIQGLTAFFESAGSDNVYASLGFFPNGGGLPNVCETTNYGKYAVVQPLTPLEEGTKFVTAMNLVEPDGGTPTLPALQGSLEYASQLSEEYPRSKNMVVLVTDGEPSFASQETPESKPVQIEGCPGNNIPTIAQVAEAYYKDEGIVTHVIGVGTHLARLNAIAQAGGSDLLLLELDDPEKTKQTLLERLQEIRELEFSCDVELPEADGGVVDVNKLNVLYQSGEDSEAEMLHKNTGCANDQGSDWQYDNDYDPQSIRLCPKTCDRIKVDPKASLQIQLGCLQVVR